MVEFLNASIYVTFFFNFFKHVLKISKYINLKNSQMFLKVIQKIRYTYDI